jgi:AbrB family looped-hinge helix DNA binding protein
VITSRVTSKGQITLPRKVRQALAVKPGDRVQFLVEDQAVLLRPLGSGQARTLAGSLRRYAVAGAAGEERAAVQQEVARAAAQEGEDSARRAAAPDPIGSGLLVRSPTSSKL